MEFFFMPALSEWGMTVLALFIIFGQVQIRGLREDLKEHQKEDDRVLRELSRTLTDVRESLARIDERTKRYLEER